MQYKLSPYRWIILFLAIFAYALVFLQRMMPTVMADAIMIDFGIGGTFMGVLAAAYFYPYAIMQIPSGLLSDKMSARKLIFFAMLATSLGTFLFALASHENITVLGRVIVGFGVSLVLMPAYKALSNWFTAKVFVIIMSSVMAVAGGIGAAFAGSPLAWFIENFGWRTTSMGLGFTCLAVSIALLFFFKDSPAEMNLPLPEEKNTEKKESLSTKEGLLIVIKKKNYWFLSIGFFLNGAFYFSFNGLWAGLFYTNICGLSREEMSSILSVSAILTAFTPVLFASLSSKIPSYKTLLLIYSLVFTTVMSWLFFRYTAWGHYEVYIWGILIAITMTAPPAIFLGAIRQLIPENISGTATGLVYAMPMLGSAIYQPLIGFIVDSMGFTNVLNASMFQPITILYLANAILSVIAILLLKEKDKKLLSE